MRGGTGGWVPSRLWLKRKKAQQMMKRLLIALAMAAAVSVAFAKVTHTNDFETSRADLVPSVADEDASELLDHASAPGVAVPYPFSGFGEKINRCEVIFE